MSNLPEQTSPAASRRNMLFGSALAATSAMALSACGGASAQTATAGASVSSASVITMKDGTQIYYKDWGPRTGPVVMFSHGWPLSADAWEDQMMFLSNNGFRCIAHDRRGHGRSSQPWDGNNMDQYADDLAALVEALGITSATFVGHSTGGGEVARYIGRYGTSRAKKAVLIGSVTPLMLKTAGNPGGLPIAVFDGIRTAVKTDRAQFWRDLSTPFFGFNRGIPDSQGKRDAFEIQGLQCGLRGAFECIKQFSETDFTEDLKKMAIPTLVIHGDDDQIVPIDASARAAVKLLPTSKLIEYAGGAHGLPQMNKDQLNADLLAFIK